MFCYVRKLCAAIAAAVGITGSLIPSVVLAQADTWQTLRPMPTARIFGAGGAIGGKVYVTNGSPPGATSLEVYDPSNDSWTTRAPSPSARGLMGSAVVDDILYVIGGCFRSDCRIGLTDLTEAYNSISDSWATMKPMPTPRAAPAVGVIDGKIYVAGGVPACPPCQPQPRALEVFDPATNSWDTKAQIPTARESAMGAVVDGKLYVLGGFVRPANVRTGIVEIYDPATDMWTTGTPMLTARSNAAAVVIDGHIHVIGGQTDSLTVAIHEVYDPAANMWSTKAPMTVRRYGLMAAEIGSKLYAAGGIDDSNAITSAFEVYTAPDTIPPVLSVPADFSIDATSPAGAIVIYTVTATDDSGVTPTVSCFPPSGGTFTIAATIVNCTATDAAGNSTTDSFTVAVNDAATQTSNLISVVQSFNLSQGITNSLDVKLQNVIDALGAMKGGNTSSACNLVGAFINEAQAQSGGKLTAAQANLLIASANQIRAVQGCT